MTVLPKAVFCRLTHTVAQLGSSAHTSVRGRRQVVTQRTHAHQGGFSGRRLPSTWGAGRRIKHAGSTRSRGFHVVMLARNVESNVTLYEVLGGSPPLQL